MKKSKKIILIAAACVIAAVIFAVMPVLTVIVYEDNFGGRYETAEWMAYSVSDFEGLRVEECTFASNDGQLLAGYGYYKENQEIKGVVVIAHGLGGGGHNTYMDVADYFTSHGYLVFAYDATGTDKSGGDAVEGLPQGVIDLDYALRYVKQADTYKDLPIVLFGHSWGGYSAGNVLNCHPDVKAAVLVAGFDRSTELFEQQGRSMAGSAIELFMPYVALYERIKFGKYAGYSAIEGFANSDAGIMIIHSKDDTTVLPENGYDKFYAAYGGDSRFCFVEYEDRGHGYIYYSEEAKRYREQLNKDYTAYVQANGGQYSAELKAAFMKENLDKGRCYEFDDALMERILAFYDSHCAVSISADIPDAVLAEAEAWTLEEYEYHKRVSPGNAYGDWRIESLAHCYTYENFEGMVLQVYRMNIQFLSDTPKDVALIGGMSVTGDGWVVPDYANSRYLVFRQEGDTLTLLTRMFENDCEAGDEVFTHDLEHQWNLLQHPQETPTLTINAEGEPYEIPAVLVQGNGYSFYLPEGEWYPSDLEGWADIDDEWEHLFFDGWTAWNNEEVRIWIARFEGQELDSVEKEMTDRGYGVFGDRLFRQNGEIIYGVELKAAGADTWGIFYRYPVDCEEGWGAQIDAFSDTFAAE